MNDTDVIEDDSDSGTPLAPVQSLSSAAASYGYAQAGGSTLNFLKKIEGANGHGINTASTGAGPAVDEQFAVKERFKSLIRQLPAKSFVQKLVTIYFREFNYNYYPLDEDIFREQLAEWSNLSFTVLSASGPQGLSPDLRVFPALLFQVIGTALLVLTEDPNEFDQLKYAGQMSFEDLGSDYSDSGVAILNLLGKRQITLTAVQASFLRANFLKFTGKVTESWHSIGGAIKDAQEIGMHRDSLDPQPASDDTGDVLENMWLVQRRRRLFMVLSMWDAHCAVVLGRPGTLDWRYGMPTLPMDTPIPKDRRKTPPMPRDPDRDAPTPITKQIVAYRLILPLVQVIELERDGTCPKNYDRVDRVHESVMRSWDEVPAFFRPSNPDRTWDEDPSCTWLPATRYYMEQQHHFGLLALHRPYLYNRRESRSQALHASIVILESQMETFRGLDPKSWRNFLLFFGSFDAAVLLASVYILFPMENMNLAGTANLQFRWTIERFEAMQDRNRLAKAGKGVLEAIYVKFRKAIEKSGAAARSQPSTSTSDNSHYSTGDSTATGTTNATMRETDSPLSSRDRSRGNNLDGKAMSPHTQLPTPLPPRFDMSAPTMATYSRQQQEQQPPPPPPPPAAPLEMTDWVMPTNFDFSNMQPLFPMSDIAYNGLNTLGIGEAARDWGNDGAGMATTGEVPSTAETFEGDFGGDSFWSFMNQFDAGQMQ